MWLGFGAGPVFEFARVVVGVDPIEPGFRSRGGLGGRYGSYEAECGSVWNRTVRKVFGGEGKVKACEGVRCFGAVGIVDWEACLGIFGP
jgi:hypothetical protein